MDMNASSTNSAGGSETSKSAAGHNFGSGMGGSSIGFVGLVAGVVMFGL